MRRIVLILLLAFLAVGAQAQTVQTHTVKPGETLYRIALRYDLTVDQLRELNGLSGTVIRVGQKLRVSAPAPDASVEAETPAVSPDPPTVDPSLPAEPNSPVEASTLLAALDSTSQASSLPTPPDSTARHAGDVSPSEIPGMQPLQPAAPEMAEDPNAYGRYEVNPTISLFDVAAATGLSVDSLLAMNPDLGPVFPDPGFIRVPVEYAVRDYRVKRGDTLFGIARAEATSVDAIRKLNDLSGDRIRVGQRLKLPGTGGATRSTAKLPKADFVGTITEYPSRFAGRLTAGGDAYDPARFTAAHVDMEIGTLVLLTHEASGRSVFAEINDRMPVRTDFVLEVSGAVAEALQSDGEPVEVRIISHD